MARHPQQQQSVTEEKPVVKSDRAARGGPLSPQVLRVLVASLTLAAIAFAALMIWWSMNTPSTPG